MNVLDIETYIKDEKIIPYCCVFYFKKKYYFNYGIDCLSFFIKETFDKNFKKETIFVHNINFDGFLIIECLSKLNIFFEIFSKGLNLYLIIIKHFSKEIHIKCSYKILPLSLEKISIIFNIGKKMIFPYTFVNENNLYYIGPIPNLKFFNNTEDYHILKQDIKIFNLKEYTITYCKNDVIITTLFIENLSKIVKEFSIDLKSVFSAPSLSLKIFIKKFNKNKIKLKNNTLIDKIIRKSYFGGRCEVYGNSTKTEFIYHFDFTGMYAQCMKQHFPIGNYTFLPNPTNFNKPGFYFIEYISKNEWLPVLPHHRISDSKLMFTNGCLKGIFWFEEILLFLNNNGKILKIEFALIFSNYDIVFNEFIDFFTNLRKKSEAYNSFSKLMINSMYGRLGMRDSDTISFVERKEKVENINKKYDVLSIRNINEISLIEIKATEKAKKDFKKTNTSVKNNIVLASCITSKARIKLYNAQKSVINNGGRILYSDTDSIYAAYPKNVLGEKHGEVFWDGSKKDTVIAEAIFFSPKSYAIKYPNGESVIKIKGYNEKKILFDEIKLKFDQNEKLILDNYKYLNKRDLELRFLESKKTFDLNFYDKRYFINHQKTLPYKYDNFQYFIDLDSAD